MKILIDSDMVRVPSNCHECFCGYGGFCAVAPSETDGLCADEDKPEWCPITAQEPRVMALDEVEALPYGYVLIETDKSGSLRWLDALLFCKNVNFSFDFITLEGRARLLGTEYNREWRCWTSRPDEKRREETPWEQRR